MVEKIRQARAVLKMSSTSGTLVGARATPGGTVRYDPSGRFRRLATYLASCGVHSKSYGDVDSREFYGHGTRVAAS